MGFTNIDNELNVKIFEIFRLILKDEDVKIVFEEPIGNILVMNTISKGNHLYKIYKYSKPEIVKGVNYKYYKLLNKKIRNENNALSSNKLINYVSNIKYFKFLKYFLGNSILEFNNNIYMYNINYNGVVLPIDKANYDKLMYYIEYTYKIQQLRKLNKTLNIEQTFNIFFEEEVIPKESYDTFYEYFKGILKPK